MIIIFRDADRSRPVDQTGYNKIGIITANGTAVFQHRRRIVRVPEANIELFPQYRQPLPPELDRALVDQFFLENYPSVDLFHLGLHKVLKRESHYFMRPLRLPMHDEIDGKTHADRWRVLEASAQRFDLLFTFDTRSWTSRLISLIDNGPWSHVAIVTGDGTVIEATTSGIREDSISMYSARRFRLGLYRVEGGIQNPDAGITWARSKIGKEYSYKKAAISGLQKMLSIPRWIPTPNDSASSEYQTLICRV